MGEKDSNECTSVDTDSHYAEYTLNIYIYMGVFF